VEVWDGAAWVPIHYDSGLRDVSALVDPTVMTGASLLLRREDSTVSIRLKGAWAATTTTAALTLTTLPAGFRPRTNDFTYFQMFDFSGRGAPATFPGGNILVQAAGVFVCYGTTSGKTRTSRPNTSDRLVEVWDGAAWVPIHYDSGWRVFASWGTDGVITGVLTFTNITARTGVAGAVMARRVLDRVDYSFTGMTATAGAKIDGWPGGASSPWLPGGPPWANVATPGVVGETTFAASVFLQAGNKDLAYSVFTKAALPTSLPGTLHSTAT
jgi:hypothetical protein